MQDCTGLCYSDVGRVCVGLQEFLVAFPSTADNTQVGSFHESLLSLLSELCSEALHSGEVVPVSHAVALVNVLFDDALCGLFSSTTLRGALELCLRVAREVAGTPHHLHFANRR